MPTHQSPAQRKTVKRVMHEFKHGELKTAAGKRKVKNPKQAIAIALHEAGASKSESKEENARYLRRTKQKERRGETGQDAAEGRGRKSASKRAASGKRSSGTKRSASAAARSSSGTRSSSTKRSTARKSAPATRRASSAARSSSAKRSPAAKRTSRAAKSRSRGDGKTRAELYAEAKRRNIAGRSGMNKAQLERALQR